MRRGRKHRRHGRRIRNPILLSFHLLNIARGLDDIEDEDYEYDGVEYGVGDILLMLKSKYRHQVVEIDNPRSYRMKVKVMGIGRTRHKVIGRCDIQKKDEFLTAVYKANASAG